MTTSIIEFTNYAESIKKALDKIGAHKVLGQQTAILIKPSLRGPQPFPVTTSVECCDAVLEYVRACSKAEVVVGEGCHNPMEDTHAVFLDLGYADWAVEKGIHLIDLNHAPLEWYENPDCEMFPELCLPAIAFTHYIISVPVLKAHMRVGMCGTMKNMLGLAPPSRYVPDGGCWKTEVTHDNTSQAIIDLNRYRNADLTVMDASVGLAKSHVGGPRCNPPIRKILAGFDPLDLDRTAAGLLGIDWHDIEHLKEL